MPMIPAGIVDGPLVAVDVPKFSWGNPVAPPVQVVEQALDDSYCLTADSFIDNKAQTNKWAKEVAEILEMEMDAKDPEFCAGIVILAGQRLNFRFGQVSEFTGLPRYYCRKVIQNLGYNRLVFGRRLAGDLMKEADKPETEADGHLLQVLFTLYCLAGAGRVRHDKGLWSALAPEDVEFYEIKAVA